MRSLHAAAPPNTTETFIALSRRLNTSPRGHGVNLCLTTQGHTVKIMLAIAIGLPIAAQIITIALHTVLAPLLRVLGN
jgi:hypothetical protein